MDVIGPQAVFREHVAPRVAAPSAELLLDAMPVVTRGQRILEVSAGTGILTSGLIERMRGSGAGAELVVVAREDLAALESAPESVRFVRANAERLPFLDGTFDVVAGNLALGARNYDAARMAAIQRSLKPGGVVVLTALLAGSFDEAFDVLTEVSEQKPDARLRAAVTDARSELYEEDELLALLTELGFSIDAWGEEERALWYPSGSAAVTDPLLFEALAQSWLGHAPDEDVRQEAARFLDTYFEGGRFAVRVRTGVVRALAPG